MGDAGYYEFNYQSNAGFYKQKHNFVVTVIVTNTIWTQSFAALVFIFPKIRSNSGPEIVVDNLIFTYRLFSGQIIITLMLEKCFPKLKVFLVTFFFF